MKNLIYQNLGWLFCEIAFTIWDKYLDENWSDNNHLVKLSYWFYYKGCNFYDKWIERTPELNIVSSFNG